MKNLILFVSVFISINLFSQTNPTSSNISNTEIYSDTVTYDINKFTSEYAKEMSTWSDERKEWFNKTFAYTRGNIRIPKEPIVEPKWND